jgi:uridine kinase
MIKKLIGITGISCCGKTTFAKNLCEKLGPESIYLTLDDYYKELTKEQYKILYSDDSNINFDEPQAFDFKLLYKDIRDLKSGKNIKSPIYDIGKCIISGHNEIVASKYKYIILDGIMLFCDPDLADLCDMKIWVETSEYVCALRRMIKYTQEIEGYSANYTYNQCLKFVIPGQEK